MQKAYGLLLFKILFNYVTQKVSQDKNIMK